MAFRIPAASLNDQCACNRSCLSCVTRLVVEAKTGDAIDASVMKALDKNDEPFVCALIVAKGLDFLLSLDPSLDPWLGGPCVFAAVMTAAVIVPPGKTAENAMKKLLSARVLTLIADKGVKHAHRVVTLVDHLSCMWGIPKLQVMGLMDETARVVFLRCIADADTRRGATDDYVTTDFSDTPPPTSIIALACNEHALGRIAGKNGRSRPWLASMLHNGQSTSKEFAARLREGAFSAMDAMDAALTASATDRMDKIATLLEKSFDSGRVPLGGHITRQAVEDWLKNKVGTDWVTRAQRCMRPDAYRVVCNALRRFDPQNTLAPRKPRRRTDKRKEPQRDIEDKDSSDEEEDEDDDDRSYGAQDDNISPASTISTRSVATFDFGAQAKRICMQDEPAQPAGYSSRNDTLVVPVRQTTETPLPDLTCHEVFAPTSQAPGVENFLNES